MLKLQLIYSFHSDGSKTAVILKKVILRSITLTFRRYVMVGNITFLMIFEVFDPSPLTLLINCSRL